MRATITGVGYYVPETKLTNFDLETMVDTSDEWIFTRTGIKERRILDKDKGMSYMAVRAGQKAMELAGVCPEEIDLLLMATITPDMPVPGGSFFVQEALGAKNAWCYDINAGCCGFISALVTGAQFVESGRYKKVLVIGSDKMSSITDYTDRSTCILFGDAAGAAILEPAQSDDEGIIDFIMKADGAGVEYLKTPAGGSLMPPSHETIDQKLHYFYQDGQVVYKHAVRDIAGVAEEIINRNNLPKEDIDLLVPHQANLRIINAAASRLKLAPEKVVINIDRFGNSSGGTVPTALAEAWGDGRIKKGDWVLLAAFGAGFIWGSVLIKWTMDEPQK